jgi:plasminogen activator inhibitor 1 RNA-binding protein
MSYGVGVTNRFDLLGDDENGSEVVVKAKKVDAKPAEAPQAVKPTQERKPVTADKRPSRPSFKGDRGAFVSDPATNKPERAERGERRPRSGPVRPGKREFDRRSGSDKSSVKPEDKRRGGGRFNWGEGVPKTETAEEPKTEAEALTTAEGDAKLESGETPQSESPAADEPKELTLAEYKKQLEKTQQSLAALKLRQAGQDVDKAIWKDTVEMKRESTPEGIFSLRRAEEKTSRRSATPRDTRDASGALPLNIRFNDTGREPRGDKFDRGRGRRTDAKPHENGNGPRRSTQRAPDVLDKSAFPVLGQ